MIEIRSVVMYASRRLLAKCLQGKPNAIQQIVRHFRLTHASAAAFSRFPVPDIATLPEDLQKRMKKYALRSGEITNVFSALSYRPEELRAFLDYHEITMTKRGSLTSAEKEMVILATSAANKCASCIVIHGALHRLTSRNSKLADQIAGNWETAELDDRQWAILDFAMDVLNCRPITDEKIASLEKYGLSKDDAWDIGSAVAYMCLVNRMVIMLNVKPNDDFYTLGRTPKGPK